MVVAIPSPIAATPIAAATSTIRAHKSPSPHHHCPLAPSEKDNAALSRKPHAKEISSRFLPSSSSSSSTSTSRCAPSPLPTSSSSGPKRSHSVDRSHPSAAAKGSGATLRDCQGPLHHHPEPLYLLPERVLLLLDQQGQARSISFPRSEALP